MERNEKFVEAVNEVGEARSYSGRCMFGKQCVGVTVENMISATAEIIGAYLRNAEDNGEEVMEAMDEVADIMRGVRWDNMGRDMIMYWPSIAWTGKEEEDELPTTEDGEEQA